MELEEGSWYRGSAMFKGHRTPCGVGIVTEYWLCTCHHHALSTTDTHAFCTWFLSCVTPMDSGWFYNLVVNLGEGPPESQGVPTVGGGAQCGGSPLLEEPISSQLVPNFVHLLLCLPPAESFCRAQPLKEHEWRPLWGLGGC